MSSHAAGAACAGPLVVTNGQDAKPHPPAGSLRFVLDHAHRNDTVTFCDSTLVTLVAPLDIVSGEDGVTVTGGHIGGVAGEGIVRVTANGVKFTNDKFAVRLSITGADDVQLSGDQFDDVGGTNGTSEAAIEADRALRLTLEHVEVNAIQDEGLSVRGSSVVTVADSVFNVMHHTAINVESYPLSRALTIRNTISDGSFDVAPLDGLITGNTINGGRQGRGIIVTVPNDGHLAGYGRLTVSDNLHLNGASIDAKRSNIDVSGNSVSKGPGIAVVCDSHVAHGTVELTRNTSMQTSVGLAYFCPSATVQATSKNNAATQNTVAGFRFSAHRLASSYDSATGGKGDGVDLACVPSGGGGALTLTSDTVTEDRAGVRVRCKDRHVRVDVSGGSLLRNRGDGLDLAAPEAAVRGVTVSANQGAGVTVQALSKRTTLEGNTITANRATGVTFKVGSAGVISGGHVGDNLGRGGIVIEGGTRVRVTGVSMSGDAGDGLAVVGGPRPPKLVYSSGRSSILGTTCPGCVVEAYAIESGPRTGHSASGEGSGYVRSLRANRLGRFRYPASCATAKTLTFTATQLESGGGRTSGFSSDVRCFLPIRHLEVALMCFAATTVSAPITVSDPTDATPVIYVASFPPHHFCGTQSYYLIDADTGKMLSVEPVIFLPDTTAYAQEFRCVDHPQLAGCEGASYPGSQAYVVGLAVTNKEPDAGP